MKYTKSLNLVDYYKNTAKDLHISYKGPIDTSILQVMGRYLEELLSKHPIAGKKLFKVFIELAQNISYYSAEKSVFNNGAKEIGIGTVLVKEFIDYYVFVTGNLVNNEDIDSIIEKSEHINSLNRDELREYKRQQRRLPQGEKGGANIGLIQVALTSSNPLDIELSPVDKNHSFFSIAVKIDK